MEQSYLLLCYPKCTTCRKAQKWLDDQGITYEPRNIKEKNPTVSELKKWSAQGNIPVRKLFNTSGLLYKSLALKDKLPVMSAEEQFALLATDGMLVRRPLLVGKDSAMAGFKEQEWAELLHRKNADA